jgi:hypothetical protein
MQPSSRLVAVIAAASASASFTATPATSLRRSRARIHSNTPSEVQPRQTQVQMESKNQWMEKGARREERISYLKTKGHLSASESGELNGLISRCCDPPDGTLPCTVPIGLFMLMMARTRVLHITPHHPLHRTRDGPCSTHHTNPTATHGRFRGLQFEEQYNTLT